MEYIKVKETISDVKPDGSQVLKKPLPTPMNIPSRGLLKPAEEVVKFKR